MEEAFKHPCEAKSVWILSNLRKEKPKGQRNVAMNSSQVDIFVYTLL